MNHVSALTGSSSLLIRLPPAAAALNDVGQYLVPVADVLDDDCIIYNGHESSSGDDGNDGDRFLLVGVKSEYRDLMDVSRIKSIFSERDCTFIVTGTSFHHVKYIEIIIEINIEINTEMNL